MVCHRIARVAENLCNQCKASYSHAWVVGSRQQALKELIDTYKFERARLAYASIVDLLDAVLPHLPPDITVVPIPTIASHVRVRGYDHMALIGRELAKRRRVRYMPLLKRATTTVQRGANRSQRHTQAKQAFQVPSACEGGRYLVIDDICTTGFTLEYAARALRTAGATEVWVATVATQPLEN